MVENITFYGRRKGRPLRLYKQELLDVLLPQVELQLPECENIDLRKVLPYPQVWLEIGFGNGDHLAGVAQKNPDIGFIGAEVFANGIGGLLKKIDQNEINNICIYPQPVGLLLDKLPKTSLDRIFILFPDPWPKHRHHKRRLIQPEFLTKLSCLLKPGGLLRIASDHKGYTSYIQSLLAENRNFIPHQPETWLTQPEDWIETRYEARGKRLGHTCVYMDFKKVHK